MSDIDLLFAYPIIFACIPIDSRMSIEQADQLGPRSTTDVGIHVWKSKSYRW